ncbi:MAG: hypothetical protein KBA26_00325 [Candidatus Delongbacteria bacterium]|nr:hypothetical protein [Candidatus Delongbacteria bacterium]
MINMIFEPTGLLFAHYDLTSDSLTPLWSIYTESENNKYKGCKTHHMSIQHAFSNGQSFLCSTQEYKIRHWVGDLSIGYYTNPYFPYEFLEIDSVSEKECEEKYKRNWLNMNCIFRLYFVEDRYLLIDLWQREGDMVTDTINRTASDGMIMTYYDLIDTQQKKIYSHIPKSNHFFIGTWNNLFIERDIINEAEPMNDMNPAHRCIKLYRLNTDKLL